MQKFLTVALLFILVSSVYSQVPQIPGLSSLETYVGTVKYDFNLKMYEKGKKAQPSSDVKGTVWRKGKLERKELEMMGKKSIMFTLKDGIYTYMPEQKMAMKQRLPEVKPEQPGEKAKVTEPKKIGEEQYDNKLCEIYEQEVTTSNEKTGKENKVRIKYWAWKDKKIPIKTISTVEEKDKDGKLITLIIEQTYSNIDFKNVPDTLVALPEGTQIVDMTQIPGPGVPGMVPTPPAGASQEKPKEEKPKKKGFGFPKLP